MSFDRGHLVMSSDKFYYANSTSLLKKLCLKIEGINCVSKVSSPKILILRKSIEVINHAHLVNSLTMPIPAPPEAE